MSAPASPQEREIIEKSWRKLHLSQAARKAVVSSLKIALASCFILVDLSYAIFSSLFLVAHPLVWFVELSVAVLLLFQIVSNGLVLCQYLLTNVWGGPVTITEEQRRLMAIPINDKSFCTPRRTTPSNSPQHLSFKSGDNTPYSPSTSLAPLISPSDTPTRPSSHNASYISLYSSTHSSPISPHQRSFTSTFNTSFNTSLDRSLNVSQSSGRFEPDRSSVRSRRSASVPLSSRATRHGRITDIETLNRLITQEEEREINRTQASPDQLNTGPSSFWSYGSNPTDLVHTLRRYVYQMAPSSPATPTLSSAADSPDSRGVGEAWIKYGVSEDQLYAWTEKLRKWLSFTIISRLNEEIEEVNSTLSKIGCEDTQIGEVGVSTLKQIALTKSSFVPSLNPVVPYLEVSANQEYLRRRIKDLSTGSVSEFTWDKGGNYGKKWAAHLPSDAALVVHLLCCYLDSRLPAEPRFPDGKSFTAQHFIKTPDKPDLTRKENLLIYQSGLDPPHFQVVIGTQSYNLQRGRNNMFQAILLFLYHIKVKENGMLGRVNLGMSGLNMLWIFD